jgi:hypothetical protein
LNRDMDAAWIAVIGTLLGAVTGLFGSWLIERWHWKRRMETRFDKAKLRACAAFEKTVLYSRSPSAWIAVGGAARVADTGQRMLKGILAAYAQVNILGSDDVKAAADKMAEHAMEDIKLISGQVRIWRRVAPALPESRDSEMAQLRATFDRLARADIGAGKGKRKPRKG